MKNISLLSDTHSVLDERFIPHLKNSDEIWHAGDIGSLDVYDKLTKLSDVKAVYGNIDDNAVVDILAKRPHDAVGKLCDDQGLLP